MIQRTILIPLLIAFLAANAHAVEFDPSVLPKGHDYHALRDGLNNCRVRFQRDKVGRVAFLGGSITAMNGWRQMVMADLKKRFPQTKFEFIGAGVGSLGSVPHAFRLERDVLSRGPVDLLFVEAAVNDATNTAGHPERMLRGMEGVVRHARTVNPMTDIVQMHFVMPDHMKAYNAGRVPVAIDKHERVAVHYGNTSLNLAREVTDRINAGQFTWAKDFSNLHPSPFGQKLYAASIARLLTAAFAVPISPPAKHAMPDKLIDPLSYSRGRFGDLEDVKILKGFTLVPKWKPTLRAGTRAGFVNVPVLKATQAGAAFEFAFDGTGAGLMIGAGPDTGIIEVMIDGGTPKKIDTFTRWSKGLYLPWALILNDELKPGHHVVHVRLTGEHHPNAAGTALYVYQLLEN